MSFYSLMDLRPILETKSFDLSHYVSSFEYDSSLVFNYSALFF
jgi:hypothetical protein